MSESWKHINALEYPFKRSLYSGPLFISQRVALETDLDEIKTIVFILREKARQKIGLPNLSSFEQESKGEKLLIFDNSTLRDLNREIIEKYFENVESKKLEEILREDKNAEFDIKMLHDLGYSPEQLIDNLKKELYRDPQEFIANIEYTPEEVLKLRKNSSPEARKKSMEVLELINKLLNFDKHARLERMRLISQQELPVEMAHKISEDFFFAFQEEEVLLKSKRQKTLILFENELSTVIPDIDETD